MALMAPPTRLKSSKGMLHRNAAFSIPVPSWAAIWLGYAPTRLLTTRLLCAKSNRIFAPTLETVTLPPSENPATFFSFFSSLAGSTVTAPRTSSTISTSWTSIFLRSVESIKPLCQSTQTPVSTGMLISPSAAHPNTTLSRYRPSATQLSALPLPPVSSSAGNSPTTNLGTRLLALPELSVMFWDASFTSTPLPPKLSTRALSMAVSAAADPIDSVSTGMTTETSHPRLDPLTRSVLGPASNRAIPYTASRWLSWHPPTTASALESSARSAVNLILIPSPTPSLSRPRPAWART